MKDGLTANCLKVIAILAMTIDHAAWLVYDCYPIHMIIPKLINMFFF